MLIEAFRQAAKALDRPHSGTIENVVEKLRADEIDALAANMVDLLASLPIEYEISFPLPSFPGITKELVVTDHVRLIPEERQRGMLDTEGARIAIRVAGFAKNSLQHSGVREAAAILKIVLRVGVIRKMFFEGRKVRQPRVAILPETFDAEVAHYASIRQVDSGVITSVKLGMGLSKYLDGIRWSDQGTSAFADDIADLSEPLKMMYAPDAENNVQSIRRAIEWQFDAICDEDATTRFIKHCIGLEALLAEQSEEMGITEKLADRCAFLLGDTSEEREKRRRMMREVYRLRSKIVHGSVSGLSHKDTLISSRASNLLNALLTVELDSVEKWWAKRHKRTPKSWPVI